MIDGMRRMVPSRSKRFRISNKVLCLRSWDAGPMELGRKSMMTMRARAPTGRLTVYLLDVYLLRQGEIEQNVL